MGATWACDRGVRYYGSSAWPCRTFGGDLGATSGGARPAPPHACGFTMELRRSTRLVAPADDARGQWPRGALRSCCWGWKPASLRTSSHRRRGGGAAVISAPSARVPVHGWRGRGAGRLHLDYAFRQFDALGGGTHRLGLPMDTLTERKRPRWGALGRAVVRWLLSCAGAPHTRARHERGRRYLARAGIEEARILLKAQSRSRGSWKDGSTLRRCAAARPVLAARAFAADSLKLLVRDTYTTYADVGRDTLLLCSRRVGATACASTRGIIQLGASSRTRGLRLRQARHAAADLERQGYDTYVRPAGAFSTLGYFSDPPLHHRGARHDGARGDRDPRAGA